MQQKKQLKIAIIYDRINTQYGGAEVVIQAMTEIFPDAPIFTSVYDKKKAPWAKNLNIIPSFLQKIPFVTDKHQMLLPFMPVAFESFDLFDYNLIISVTSAEAKGVLTKPDQKHICYLLTPSRYIYSHKNAYLRSKWYLQLPIVRNMTQIIFKYVEIWDQAASLRPDIIIPISQLVSHRLKKFYHRQPQKVLYPPVKVELTENEIAAIQFFSKTQKFYLSVSRLVKYKHIDISISACLQLKKPLVVVGDGEAKAALHALAGKEKCVRNPDESLETFLQRGTLEEKLILFTGKLDHANTYKLFKNCEAVLMPGQEDFGITALEAGIFGKPVIVFYTSGVAEILKDSKHAIHIKKETVSEMIFALGKLDNMNFDSIQLRQNALQYDVSIFKQELKKRIQLELKGQYVIS